MPGLHDLPGTVYVMRAAVPAAATAATAETLIGRAPFASKVVGAYFIPATTQAVGATNNRHLDVINRGATGAGTAVPATILYTAGIGGTADIAAALTVSATAATVALASGDVVVAVADVTASGLPLAAGVIEVHLQGA